MEGPRRSLYNAPVAVRHEPYMTDTLPDAPLRRTPLYAAHAAAGARLVPFAGWEMPVHYGSQLNEHHAVRGDSGMFDVSHMAIIDLAGAGCREFLQRVIANDVGRLTHAGKALYGVLLNPAGGVIDDLIVYRRDDGYRIVSNAGTRARVIAWLKEQNREAIVIVERDLAMIAVQGPRALERFAGVTGWTGLDELAPFNAAERDEWMVARTGYTGEDGVEAMLPAADAVQLWQALGHAGVAPIGLGARDTLRLEAGLNLYGQDMDESTSPLVANLGWTIAWKPSTRDFIGRTLLEAERAAGVSQRLAGLAMEARGVLRHGQLVRTAAGNGVVTSGIFSPTLGYSIALARVPRQAEGACEVEIRGKPHPARIVKPPFVRNGRKVFE
jgi:aminomethyltransferase